MKKIIILLVAAVMTATSLSAQDLITKKDGTDIQAKILEVNKTELKYKRWDNQDGPTFTIDKSDVLLVRYQNGTNEVFNETATPATHQAVTPARTTSQPNRTVNAQNTPATGDFFAKDPSQLSPGMDYNDISGLYNTSDYPYLTDPQYSPARAWMNLLLPGLAQISMGEAGEGFGYLGLCLLGPAVTAGVSLFSSNTTVLATFAVIGTLHSLLWEIGSISNAMTMAKIKSLYLDDMEKMATGYSFAVTPTVVPTRTPAGLQMVPSIGLRVSF